MSSTDPVERILSRLQGVKRCGDFHMALCPGHNDHNPSLSIRRGDNGSAVIYCHALCKPLKILAAIGFTLADLYPKAIAHGSTKTKDGSSKPYVWRRPEDFGESLARRLNGRMTSLWYYHNSSGEVVFAVVRVDSQSKKTYRPLRPVEGGWSVGDPSGPLPLFQLPRVQKAIAKGEIVWVAEGEKCVEAFTKLGIAATTSAHGALSAKKSDWSPLAGANVVLNPDNNAAGERYMDDVANLLSRLNPRPSIQCSSIAEPARRGRYRGLRGGSAQSRNGLCNDKKDARPVRGIRFAFDAF